MNNRKKRRYRKNIEREDHFTELMGSITGGSRNCECCTLVVPESSLNNNICRNCRSSIDKVKKFKNNFEPKIINSEDVYVDASYREGIAGIAIVGGLGEHYRCVEANSSTHAEILALSWSIEIAKSLDNKGIVFNTDCQAAYNLHKNYNQGNKYNFIIKLISRRYNQRADYLAGIARIKGV